MALRGVLCWLAAAVMALPGVVPPAVAATAKDPGAKEAARDTAKDTGKAPGKEPDKDNAAKDASAKQSGKGAAKQTAAPDPQIAQLDTLRQQCIAAARAVQDRERAVGAVDLAVTLMREGAETKDRELARSRREQEQLLGALERLARAPPEALAFAPEGPVDRVRSGILIAAAVPALAAQARELTGQLTALGTVHKQVETSRTHVEEARAALDKSRTALAQLVAQRNALEARLLHADKPEPVKPGDAADLYELIKKAAAAAEQRDKERPARLRTEKGAPADPTKPKTLVPTAQLNWPVRGEVTHHAAEADASGKPRLGVTLAALPRAVVVAPFDGRVLFAGAFRDYGLILIISHGGDYHSVLAGLGRADVTVGQWVAAGEPVGSLADAAANAGSASLYMELRRGGYPVNPEPRIASGGEKTEETRVR
ncbi:MAG: peptidoglycan DD-metalloendopeptidase family protein [Alphaproteobacteria bacterium]|nr:peptidoglycan DD-metalloendopeptidase family protein [Alphaproteobacteria bacterium]